MNINSSRPKSAQALGEDSFHDLARDLLIVARFESSARDVVVAMVIRDAETETKRV